MEDFWRMMWEYQCGCIVMLCQLEEDGQVCATVYLFCEDKSVLNTNECMYQTKRLQDLSLSLMEGDLGVQWSLR